MLDELLPPVYDIWYVPWWKTPTGWCMLVIGGLIALGCLALLLRKCISRPKKLSPYEHATRELSLLLSSRSDTLEDQKRIYSKLTMLLKESIEKKYAVAVQSSTETEFVALIEPLVGVSAQTIGPVLARANESKYAHEVLQTQQIQDDIEAVRQFLSQLLDPRRVRPT